MSSLMPKPVTEDVVPVDRGRYYTVGTTEPTNRLEGAIWCDTNTNPGILKQCISGSYVGLAALYPDTARTLIAQSAGGTNTTPINDTVTMGGLSILPSQAIEIEFSLFRSGAAVLTLGLKLNTTIIQDDLWGNSSDNVMCKIYIPRRDRGAQALSTTTVRHGMCLGRNSAVSKLTKLGLTSAVPLNVNITSIALRAAAATGTVEVRNISVWAWN